MKKLITILVRRLSAWAWLDEIQKRKQAEAELDKIKVKLIVLSLMIG